MPGNSSTALLREKVLDLGRGGNDWVTFDAAQPLDITTRTYVDITNIVTSTGETLRSSELGQGDSYYADWEAPTLGAMPPFLHNLYGIKTNQADRHHDSNDREFLCFDVHQDVIVYVLMDHRLVPVEGDPNATNYELPAWLSTRFENTKRLVTVDGDPEMGHFVIFKAHIHGQEEHEGHICLGGNAVDSSCDACSNYIVMVAGDDVGPEDRHSHPGPHVHAGQQIVPDGDYILLLNSSNTRGWVLTEEIYTLKKCGCMDIFNSEFDLSARHHAPFMCDSHTFEGADKVASEGEFVYYEQHLSDSVFAVEISLLVESGNVDVYTSVDGQPTLRPSGYDTLAENVSAVDWHAVSWEYRVPFNVLMEAPGAGARGHKHPFIGVKPSLYLGVYGKDDFSRYSIRTRNVKFQEERINLPDWEPTNDMVESGRYKFYELRFAEAANDMDVKVSVQCKVGNITLFVAKRDKYPSEFRTFTQMAHTEAGGLAEVIDSWQPEEERVVFIAVRGNDGGYADGYPHKPGLLNEYMITARSYRYSGEATPLDAPLKLPEGNATSVPPVEEGAETERYSEVALDNFKYYQVEYSDTAFAIEVTLSVSYGVVDLYANFDSPPTQGRFYQRAAALMEGPVTISMPFDAVESGIGSIYLGVFGRETDFSNYNISVVETRFANASTATQPPPTLINGTWITGLTNAASEDGYRFFRTHVGPEHIPMGKSTRSGPGSKAAHPGTDPESWGEDWQEEWVQTWAERHDDEYDFDVYATVTVQVHPAGLDSLPWVRNSAGANATWDGGGDSAWSGDGHEGRRRTQSDAIAFRAAAHAGDEGAFMFLLDADVDVNEVDESGHTALMLAAQGGHEKIVAELIKKGASLDATNALQDSGSTALMYAARSGWTGVVRQLLTAGADHALVIHRDGARLTALDLAREEGFDEVAAVLASWSAALTTERQDIIDSWPPAVRVLTPQAIALRKAAEAEAIALGLDQTSEWSPTSYEIYTEDGLVQYPEFVSKLDASDGESLGYIPQTPAGPRIASNYRRAQASSLSRDERDALEDAATTAGGVSLYASMDWPYPSRERVRDAETHRLGGAGPLTVATLTLPVWTDFGRTMHIGVKTEQPGVKYDIKVEYSVQEEQRITEPVAHPHKPCPSVAVPISEGFSRLHVDGNDTSWHSVAGVTMQVECNGHGACVDGRCICETGFHGEDCATVPFSQAPTAARIKVLSPRQGTVWSTTPVDLSFSVANAPAASRVLLLVDGAPYPKEHTNILEGEGLGSRLGIFGLYSGRHTAQLILTASDGTPLTSAKSHFVVAAPGGCANDCDGHGVCMDGNAGQYCICNEGWLGVDCSKPYPWRSASQARGLAGAAGVGLAEELVRQLEESLGHARQQTALELEALGRRVAANDLTVTQRMDGAARARDEFLQQVEADSAQLGLEQEALLEELHRSRQRLERESENAGAALRRTLTARTESHHSTIDALQADRHRVQNKMTRIQRTGDIRWAMMNDEFEYADLRQKFAVDAVRNFEESKWNRIDDIAPSDCSQDDAGRWSCFFKNSAKDCESGDIMRWDSVEEATKYPVQCRAPIGRDAPLMQHGGEGDAVRRPFSYQADGGETAPTREAGFEDVDYAADVGRLHDDPR